jgi:predicted TIM-barrel fold metal-dependent hydrolase
MSQWGRYVEAFSYGDFPVDRLSCSYTVLWNQFKKLTKNFSASERSAMFHDTNSGTDV